MVTVPIVIGYALLAFGLAAALVLGEDEQPAITIGTAKARTRNDFMNFLPGRKEGETAGVGRVPPLAGTITLPARVDNVQRDWRRPGLGPYGPSQLRDSAGMVRGSGRHRLRYLARCRG
jgi:hypothetical protein